MDEEKYQTEMTALRAEFESSKAAWSAELASTKRLVVWCAIGGALVSILSKVLIPAPGSSAPIHAPPAPSTIETGNVTIGEVKPESRKVYLTTGEVAEAERISDRQVVQLISTGRIHPQPERSGRAWRIAADYRILPQTAAVTATTETP